MEIKVIVLFIATLFLLTMTRDFSFLDQCFIVCKIPKLVPQVLLNRQKTTHKSKYSKATF